MTYAAKNGYARGKQTRTTTRKPAWIDPLLTFMVRRGSTVRVRQRALRRSCKSALSLAPELPRQATKFSATSGADKREMPADRQSCDALDADLVAR
jgi:hypothetical protein